MPYVEWRGTKCRVRWDTGKISPETGKRIYDSKSGFADEDQAYAYGLDRESDIRNDRYISRRDGSVLMEDYCRTWPDTLDVGHLRERSIRSMIRLYIAPRWGDSTVGEIKASSFRAWRKQLQAMPNLGDRYVQEICGVFSMLMDDAVEDGLRQSSPVTVKRRRGKYKKKPRERKRHMDMADVHQLALNALTFWGFPGYVFVLTMANTGMRPAELYALQRDYCHPAWPASDPDRDQRSEGLDRYAGSDPMPALRVEFQHQRVRGTLTLLPPKYESTRSLVIPPYLAELLAMLLESHPERWVFPSIGGSPLANANFSYHYWRSIADGRDATHSPPPGSGRGGNRRPLPAIPAVPAYAGKRLYLLRHGHKEWLDEDGHSRVAVETRMGHELPGVEGVYSNVTPAMERAISASLQDRWESFVGTLETADLAWETVSPKSLPVDLPGWLKRQVSAAQGVKQGIGS